MYTRYAHRIIYRYVSGKGQMPLAAASGEARIVTKHAPVMQKVIQWTAKRRNWPPTLPSPEPTSANDELAEATITASAPTLTEDAQGVESEITGEYIYLMKSPVWVADGIQMPVMPWTTLELSNQVLAPATFVTGLF